MRPKKKILLLNEDEAELSVMRLVLVTHGYAVRGETGADAAYEEARAWMPKLLLASWPRKGGFKVEPVFSALHRGVPATALLLIAPGLDVVPITEPLGADFVLRGEQCAWAMILEAVKRMTMKHRCPRKTGARVSISVSAAEIEESPALRRPPASAIAVCGRKARVA